MKIISRLVWRVLDWLDYRIWDARLRMVDALYGPEPERDADRERNSQAFRARIEDACEPRQGDCWPEGSAR